MTVAVSSRLRAHSLNPQWRSVATYRSITAHSSLHIRTTRLPSNQPPTARDRQRLNNNLERATTTAHAHLQPLHTHPAAYFSTADTSLCRDVASSGFSSFTPSFSPCAVRIASVYSSMKPLLAF